MSYTQRKEETEEIIPHPSGSSSHECSVHTRRPQRGERGAPCLCGECMAEWIDAGWECRILAVVNRVNGWLSGSIGRCGSAIVVWCGKAAHCTLCWRKKGFDEKDVRTVVSVRKTWLESMGRPAKGGWLSCRTSKIMAVKPTAITLELDLRSELMQFVLFVRRMVPVAWVGDIAVPTPHITVYR